MAKRVLVLQGDSLEHFFLSIEGGFLTLGRSPVDVAAVLQGVLVRAIRCEVVTDEDVVWRDEAGEEQPLPVGVDAPCGPVQMRLEESSEAADASDEVPTVDVETVEAEEPLDLFAPVASAAAPAPRRRLVVVDGADKGQSFLLPEAGSAIIGNSTNKDAAIVLHDLYVAPMHCRLDVEGGTVRVTHLEGKVPTRINNQPFAGTQEIGRDDTLRVGNSYLRLESAAAEHTPGAAAGDEPWPEEVQHSRVLHKQESPPPTAAATPAARAPWPPYAGQSVGHYRLIEEIGRGHAGVTFRAEDTKTGTALALKLLDPAFPAGSDELHQFARALKAAPQLAHPHLVALHGAGKSGPLCWIAREHVAGESVAQHIDRIAAGGKASWTRAARVAVHLARALRFLHRHRVVHGNITPANVLIRAEDKQAKLADVMLAKALAGSKLEHSFMKKKLFAEAAYLAPELTRLGAVGDEASDLYAVGALAYALATGRAPFAGAGPEETIDQVLRAQPTRLTKHQKNVPPDFEAVVLKLLAKRQEDRHATAEQLLGDLENIATEHEIKL